MTLSLWTLSVANKVKISKINTAGRRAVCRPAHLSASKFGYTNVAFNYRRIIMPKNPDDKTAQVHLRKFLEPKPASVKTAEETKYTKSPGELSDLAQLGQDLKSG